MYLKHFNIQEYPFTLTPNTQFFCDLPGHQAALNILLFALDQGEGFIKIIGEVGSGKTLLCRKLLNMLSENYITAYLPNPDLSVTELRKALARELQIPFSAQDIDQAELLELIYDKLFTLREQDKKVVFVIDEAQSLPNESLEALRLLTNLETESEKLLQIVLFGQPELEKRLRQHRFRQLSQRITFSYRLPALRKRDLTDYLSHRLAVAGYSKGFIFKPGVCRMLLRASHGIPRVINILSHKAMLSAYGRGAHTIDRKDMLRAIHDSREFVRLTFWQKHRSVFIRLLVFCNIILIFVVLGVIFHANPSVLQLLSGFKVVS